MDDNSLEQRIKYLVEHGGVWDDPIADLRAGLRRLTKITALATLGVVAIVLAALAHVTLH